MGIDYGRLTPFLIKGIQELIAEGQELKQKNDNLRTRVDSLEKAICVLDRDNSTGMC